jgi:hypothetical protein
MAEEVGIYYGSCQAILTKDVVICHVTARLIPQLLTQEHKEYYFSVASDVRESAETDEYFLENIITGDKT